MDDIQPSKPIPSYKDEFHHSLDLFNKSMQAYQQSNIDNQKLAFQEVMAKASHIMQETAPQCLNSTQQSQVNNLHAHYQDFLKNPSSEMMQLIQNDLNQLKNV